MLEPDIPLKGLSLTQPWASLMELEAKRNETRNWDTRYRGWLAIHASITFPQSAKMLASRAPARELLREGGYQNVACLPTGCFICLVELIGTTNTNKIELATIPELELAFGDYSPDRFVWSTANVRRLKEQIPYSASQRLFDIPQDLSRRLFQLAGVGGPRRFDRIVQICPGCTKVIEVQSDQLARFIQRYNCSDCRDREAVASGF